MPIFVTFSDKLNFIRKTLPTRKSQASYDKMTNGAATIHVVKESKITPTTHKHQEVRHLGCGVLNLVTMYRKVLNHRPVYYSV